MFSSRVSLKKKKKLSTGLQLSKEASAEERRGVCQQALTSGRGAERPRPMPRFTRFRFFSFDGFMEFHAMPLKLPGHFYLDSSRLLHGSFLLSIIQLLMRIRDSMSRQTEQRCCCRMSGECVLLLLCVCVCDASKKTAACLFSSRTSV